MKMYSLNNLQTLNCLHKCKDCQKQNNRLEKSALVPEVCSEIMIN